MIYVDSSVALAQLFGEDRLPGAEFWRQEQLVSSRLLEYEVWNRVNSRGPRSNHVENARLLLGRVGFLDLAPAVLARALAPFPVPVRTLDGLHLASMEFLRERGQQPSLATYDQRLAEAAERLGIPLEPL